MLKYYVMKKTFTLKHSFQEINSAHIHDDLKIRNVMTLYIISRDISSSLAIEMYGWP